MRILLAGGGTGGHLYPGIALAQALLDRGGAAMFLCTDRPFDARELSAYRLEHEALPAPRLRHGWKFPRALAESIRRARSRLRAFRPEAVIGLGGYGSFPALAAARWEGIPYGLLEQNVIPGKANRLAAWGARRIYAQWEESRPFFPGLGGRFLASGSPLRRGLELLDREEARHRAGLSPQGFVVGVLGGSQGAERLNLLAVRELTRVGGIGILHLAGPSAPAVAEAYRAAGTGARVEDYRRDMGAFYSACDLVISRAGAMALAEMALLGRPCVLVPYPHAAADHQTWNARVVERRGGGILLREEAPEGALASLAGNLVRQRNHCDRMGRNHSTLARPDAVSLILKDLHSWLRARAPAWRTWSASAASA